MRSRLVPIFAVCCFLLAACGGSGGDGDDATAPASTPQTAPPGRGAADLPAGVPLEGSGAADPARAGVIRAWTDALRGGDVAGASALWAVPSTVQNATPVLKLRSRADVRTFNRSLPCGAVVTRSTGAPRDFTIVTFRLTQRRGGDCGTGVGNSARTAVLVRDGKIVEWYRLPDEPGGPAPEAADGPSVES